MQEFPGRKAIHYHNITPPRFFSPRTPHYEMTSRGYAQLDRIADSFALVIGDSTYNLHGYAEHLTVPTPMLCVYPLVDADALRALRGPRRRREGARESEPVWLFVGRFRPNKRQDQVMRASITLPQGRAACSHRRNEGRAALWKSSPPAGAPAARHRMTSRVGVRRDAARLYRAADRVGAAEHEGFCIR